MKKIWYKVLLLVVVWEQKSLSSEALGEASELKFKIKKETKDLASWGSTEKLLETILNSVQNDEDIKKFNENLIEYQDSTFPFKRFKRKGKKAWVGVKNFGGKIKDKTAAGWNKIKENPKTTAAVVSGLAAIGGSAYFFREGLSQNIGKVKDFSGKAWNVAKEKGSSAWEYSKEIPGKVKGKFKRS